VNQGNSTVTRY